MWFEVESVSMQASSSGRSRNTSGALTFQAGRQGQTVDPGRSTSNLVRQGNISVLPDRTGGRTVVNGNNPGARVAEIFHESDSYYLLGRPVGALRQTLTVKAQPGAAGAVYDLLQRIPAKPGRYELRIGVYNTTRHQAGSVQLFVDVPAFDKVSFTLSDIGVYAPVGTPAMQDSLADVLLAPTTARRDFDRSERATAFLRLYERGEGFPRAVVISARVIDDRGRQRFQQQGSIAPAQFGAMGTADFVLDLPLADLEGGAYLLTIAADAGGSSVRRDVRFTIR